MNTSPASQTTPATLPRVALLLGYGGLLPFVGLAAALPWLQGAAHDRAQSALLLYGAVIVSFLGAVHWGSALARHDTASAPWLWGVLPALLAWVAASLPFAWAAVALALCLAACWLADRRLLRGPAWAAYLRLRTVLTGVAMGALLAAAAQAAW